MHSLSPRRAVEAFSRGVHMPPVLCNDEAAWGGVSVCEWKLPWMDGFELSENDDFIIAHHSAGSPRVRASCEGPWSDKTSAPGLISVIPPGRRVEYVIDGDVSFSSVHVPRSMIEGLSESPFCGEARFRFAFQDAFADHCMEILLKEARAGGSCNFPYVHAVTRALLLHLMQAFRDEPVPAAAAETVEDHSGVADTALKLDRMLDFIDAHLAEPLKLEDLADRVGVSRAHFARRFRSVTGVSPHRYVTLRRVEKAKQLLKNSRSGLAEIALDAGFGSQSHFTQVFHAVTGLTPSQYRRGQTQ